MHKFHFDNVQFFTFVAIFHQLEYINFPQWSFRSAPEKHGARKERLDNEYLLL